MILDIYFGAAIHLDKDALSVSSKRKNENTKKSRYLSKSHHIKLTVTTTLQTEITVVAYSTPMIMLEFI